MITVHCPKCGAPVKLTKRDADMADYIRCDCGKIFTLEEGDYGEE